MTKQVERTRDVRKQARVWMLTHDIRSVDIQIALRMRSHSLVANTLAGRQNNKRVLRYLVEKGCPVEYLDLPKTMKGKK
ncbi:MAG TPA: hypothetical protein DCZ63_13050 [Geobacter sp.]|nr:hypothetical protein [Geobacter sp.]